MATASARLKSYLGSPETASGDPAWFEFNSTKLPLGQDDIKKLNHMLTLDKMGRASQAAVHLFTEVDMNAIVKPTPGCAFVRVSRPVYDQLDRETLVSMTKAGRNHLFYT